MVPTPPKRPGRTSEFRGGFLKGEKRVRAERKVREALGGRRPKEGGGFVDVQGYELERYGMLKIPEGGFDHDCAYTLMRGTMNLAIRGVDHWIEKGEFYSVPAFTPHEVIAGPKGCIIGRHRRPRPL